MHDAAQHVEEVAPGIHRIQLPFGERTNAAYLLTGARRSLLVDTTTKDSADELLDRCAALDVVSPTWVLTTHADWDHAAGNGVIATRSPGSILMCHERDRAMIEDVEVMISDRYGEFAADHGFDETDESKDAIRSGTAPAAMDMSVIGGEVLDLGARKVRIVHTPGHSDGSVSVHDPDNAAVIVGDAVLGAAVPLADGSPAFPPTYRFLDDYRATIDTLRSLAPQLLLTSHYRVFAGQDGTAFLDESRQFTERLDGAILGAIADRGPSRALEIAEAISTQVGEWPVAATPALLFPMAGHLENAVRDGKLTTDRDGAGRLRYSAAGR